MKMYNIKLYSIYVKYPKDKDYELCQYIIKPKDLNKILKYIKENQGIIKDIDCYKDYDWDKLDILTEQDIKKLEEVKEIITRLLTK